MLVEVSPTPLAEISMPPTALASLAETLIGGCKELPASTQALVGVATIVIADCGGQSTTYICMAKMLLAIKYQCPSTGFLRYSFINISISYSPSFCFVHGEFQHKSPVAAFTLISGGINELWAVLKLVVVDVVSPVVKGISE